jgi:hypothetical protein
LIVLGRSQEALTSLRTHPEDTRTSELRELLRSLEKRESP